MSAVLFDSKCSMGLLNAVDLFTGIGGFVLGLEGICNPLVYCDNSPVVLAMLDRLVAAGRLPRAAVVDDVSKLPDIRKAVAGKTVDIVTAGFPCVGFSSVGRREGLNDERSGLFHAAMKVVTALKPRIVLLENVQRVLTSNDGNDFKTIIDSLDKAGYDCRWSVCSANEVGLPHSRKRWFCMCLRRTADFSKIIIPSDNQRKHGKPPPLLAVRLEDYAARYSLLGNSIVPAVARLAFTRLFTGFSGGDRYSGVQSDMHVSGTSVHGFSIRGKVQGVQLPKAQVWSYEIVLDPGHYAPTFKKRTLKHRAAPILERHVLHNWPTPRSTAPRHSNSLTARNIRDLPTVALFAHEVQGSRQPAAVQGMTVNPAFVEWLMGFPANHTSP